MNANEIPTSIHVLLLEGVTFRLDAEVRKEVEYYLGELTTAPYIIITSLAGEEVTVTASAAARCVLYSSTREIREWDRALQRQIEAEEPSI